MSYSTARQACSGMPGSGTRIQGRDGDHGQNVEADYRARVTLREQ